MEAFALQLDGFGARQLGLEIGGGAAVGGIIGFAAKKVAKLIAVIVGLQLALFKFLETRGILQVNWDALTGAAGNATQTAGGAANTPPSWITSLLSALPVSAGFTGGFLVGFRKG
ncbi:FUN14 domain-containing protein [Halomicrobium salinisoli]|uniref:FUN14 domain-containing protein n=1 Tax=Halomicrobium salinisoli TaxID=2878391 RepID=UPI001CEFD172|nr:FUN14 domain-containing protein [Halomicrobium salinisoli]